MNEYMEGQERRHVELTPEEMERIKRRYREAMGFTEEQYRYNKRLRERVGEILGVSPYDHQKDGVWYSGFTIAMVEAAGTDEAKAALAQARKELEGKKPEPKSEPPRPNLPDGADLPKLNGGVL